MNPYQLKFRGRAEDQLSELGRYSERLQREVAEIILLLLDEPYPPNAVRFRGKYADRLKISVEGWRILYKVFEQDRIVAILAVLPRDRDTYVNMM